MIRSLTNDGEAFVVKFCKEETPNSPWMQKLPKIYQSMLYQGMSATEVDKVVNLHNYNRLICNLKHTMTIVQLITFLEA